MHIFQLNLPNDLFKDVDDPKLSYKISLKDGSELPKWIKSNSNSLSLSGVWKSERPLIIKVTATDTSGNIGEVKLQIDEKGIFTHSKAKD